MTCSYTALAAPAVDHIFVGKTKVVETACIMQLDASKLEVYNSVIIYSVNPQITDIILFSYPVKFALLVQCVMVDFCISHCMLFWP